MRACFCVSDVMHGFQNVVTDRPALVPINALFFLCVLMLCACFCDCFAKQTTIICHMYGFLKVFVMQCELIV